VLLKRRDLSKAQLERIERMAAVIPRRQLSDDLFKYDLLEGIVLFACESDIEELKETQQVDYFLEMNFYDENDCLFHPLLYTTSDDQPFSQFYLQYSPLMVELTLLKKPEFLFDTVLTVLKPPLRVVRIGIQPLTHIRTLLVEEKNWELLKKLKPEEYC
jgi:hypothetical protein